MLKNILYLTIMKCPRAAAPVRTARPGGHPAPRFIGHSMWQLKTSPARAERTKNEHMKTLKPMKKSGSPLIIFSIVLAMLVSGCKKWLDVTPQDKVPQKVLFSNEQGFKDAMIGVYMGMDKSTSSGSSGQFTNHLSMGLLSVLAYAYDNGSAASVGGNEALYNAAYAYNYNNVVLSSELLNIWRGLYNNIANINNILDQIDEKQGVFTGSNYPLVKGEALGLRAMLNFEALRMWGESPATGGNIPAIPYVTEFTILNTPLSTVNEAADLAIQDLHAARALLATTDTSSVKKGVTDPFTSYTQNHMNYWAVTGLLARVHQYRGNTDSALYYANAVIGTNKFPLITSDLAFVNNVVRDRTYSQEHLFSLYSSNIQTYNNTLYNGSIPLALSFSGRATLYANPSTDQTDWRYRSWFEQNANTAGTIVPSKFYQDANLPYHLQGIVPLIRVSELYYIASESVNKKGDIPGAVGYLNKVRAARGLTPLNAAGIVSPDSVSNAIMKEYKKEFLQEGQTWYYYKRLNKDLRQASGTPAPIPDKVYVFPLPDLEKEYRNG